MPSAPAIPTISPASRVKLTGPNDCPWRPSTTSTSRPWSTSGAGGGNAASNGRPTISSTSSASVVAFASNVPWFLPSRRTVIRSATSRTSGRRWLTYTTPTPRRLQPATVRCKASTSSGPRAVVGSSSSSTFGSTTSAFATSNSWRSAREREPAGASGNNSRSRSNSASSFLAHRFLLQNLGRRSSGAARKRLFFTGSGRISEVSWYAMARPSFLACAGESRRRGSPPIRTVPRSGSTNPLAIPRRVDLPDPFSPTTA